MKDLLPIRFVCATRETKEGFFAKTALGRTLSLYKHLDFVQLRVIVENTSGLPVVYNNAIVDSVTNPAILIFVHDDVYLSDFYWFEHIYRAIQYYDIVGIAGNKRRIPGQPGWAMIDENLTLDEFKYLSGVIGHGNGFPCWDLSVFGTPAQEVKLLDGVMLICKSDLLHQKGLKFDERFAFHFYDMDFCRQAEQKGLRMGTWPISVIHESDGNFGSQAWKEAYKIYLSKWGD